MVKLFILNRLDSSKKWKGIRNLVSLTFMKEGPIFLCRTHFAIVALSKLEPPALRLTPPLESNLDGIYVSFYKYKLRSTLI